MAHPRTMLIICSACVPLFAIGCATKYEARRSSAGYSDFRIAVDVFAVSFRGNTSTKREQVQKFLLRRASEITLQNGFKYFVIISEKELTRSSSVGYSSLKIPFIAPGTSVWIQCYQDRPADKEMPINAGDFLRFNYPEVLDALHLAEKASTDQGGGPP